ncbi:MAG: YkgJ family cysteine cluster protein [Methylococcales bacterium]|nr:YkgJ family cysteine cluster protein [Methylococcales bacterium]
MNTLARLHADIEDRVRAIREDNIDWLCGLGCDGCCQRLAEAPRLTAAEWDCLRDGLAALPKERLRDIGQDIAALAGQPSRPIVCPLLDREARACLVYSHRPVACRTYGFYVQRGQGLYCKDIESRIASGAWAGAVWGNQDSIDRRLCGLGDTRDLTEWFANWKEAGDMS